MSIEETPSEKKLKVLDSFEDVLKDKRKIKVGGYLVEINPMLLKFNEANLSRYIEQEGPYCDYFGQRLADAEAELQYFELKHEEKYSEKFASFKEQAQSDKLAEANAKSDVEVIKAKEDIITAKHKVKILQQHLRAWDKNHENATSRGHTLRKEMDKIGLDIKYANSSSDSGLEKKLDDIIGQSS